MTTTDEIIGGIRAQHRRRRHAMKTQQTIERRLESFIHQNATNWHPDMNDKERARVKKEVQAVIKAARDDEGHKHHRSVLISDAAAEPSLALRAEDEKTMEVLARQLPAHPWISSVPGAGALGLATIVAEAGDLSNYPSVAKLWKRLGFAPYDGHAGSTWKRETWRSRSLTDKEWIEHPFSGEKYGLMRQIATWLWAKQWIGKAKTGTGVGAPNGPYGEIYAARRAKTAVAHPDWSDGHAHSDALRIMMKKFLCDLWLAWRAAERAESEQQLVAAE
jgi:hypothetical protein